MQNVLKHIDSLDIDSKDKQLLIDSINNLVKSKSTKSSTSVIVDGTVRAIYCYYHKEWEIPAVIPYGIKQSSTTLLNTMCKFGNNTWTKVNSLCKQVDSLLLDDIQSGKLLIENLSQAKLQKIEYIKSSWFDSSKLPSGLILTDDDIDKISSDEKYYNEMIIKHKAILLG